MEKGKVLLITRDTISENIKILVKRNDKRKSLIKRFNEKDIMIRKITFDNISLEELDRFLEEWSILGVSDEEPLMIIDEKLISPLPKKEIYQIFQELEKNFTNTDLFLLSNNKLDYNYKTEIDFEKSENLNHFKYYKVDEVQGFFSGITKIKKWKEIVKLGRSSNSFFLQDFIKKSIQTRKINCGEIWPPIFYPNLSQIPINETKLNDKIIQKENHYFFKILFLSLISLIFYKYYFSKTLKVQPKSNNKKLKGILRIL